MKNILICTSSFDKKNINLNYISKSVKINFNPYGRRLTEDELLKLVNENTIGIVSGTEIISKKVLLKAINLQVISRCGTGTDNINKYAVKRKIKIFKTDKEPTSAVAEFVIAQILLALKHSYYHNYFLKKKKWKKIKGKMLSNCKVGLIGFGKIGRKIYNLLKPFKSELIIYDPNNPKFKSKNKLNLLLKNSDIITLNIPFNKKNKNFINNKKLKIIKNNAILVNCSRGGLIDEKALFNKLKKNKEFIAILDCFENEPYKGKLVKFKNIILSPHVASFTSETRDMMEKNAFLNCTQNLKI